VVRGLVSVPSIVVGRGRERETETERPPVPADFRTRPSAWGVLPPETDQDQLCTCGHSWSRRVPSASCTSDPRTLGSLVV
jgi:hypothetical protein